MNHTILRLPQVQSRTGLSRSTIYAYIAKDQFPSPIKLGARSVGWVSSSIDSWIDLRIAQKEGA